MELYDEYGVALKKGQSVAVAVSASIILKGVVTDIMPAIKEVQVRVTWPIGTGESRIVRHYGLRDDKICMSQLVVI